MDTVAYCVVIARFPPEFVPLEPDGRITLYADLAEALEEAGEAGGVILEARLDPTDVVRDPLDLGRAYTTKPIPASRFKLIGS